MHVVLVGREPATRDVFASIVRYGGALVTPAASAAEAFEVMRRVKADALVAETSAADGEGMHLIREMRLRKPEDGGVIPVVAITPAAEPLSLEQVRAAGFDATLAMPVDPWALCRLLASLVTTA